MDKPPKIKVLHITQVGGGIETYLVQIFNNIDREKFELILAAPPDRTALAKMAGIYNVTFYPIKLKWQISPIHDIISIFSILRLERKLKPDIIHTHSSKAGMIARLASLFFKSTVFYTPNGFAYLGSEGIKRKVLLLIEKMAIPFTDTLLAASISEARRCFKDLAFPRQKVKVYPNSIEILPDDKRLISAQPTKIITTVGRLVKQKNPLMYLQVCKKIFSQRKDVHFQIIGAGFEDTLRKDIEKFIADNSLGNAITIIEWMDRPSLLETIRNTDVFVMTSIFESFGYVAAEAQMLNIPVVATDIDGLNEIVKNNTTGYLVKVNDSETMAEKIISLLNDPIKASEMGENGRERTSKFFDSKKNIKRLEQLYLKAYERSKKNL
jgi:glycosyltransferase involved in cell wall biosynthesis